MKYLIAFAFFTISFLYLAALVFAGMLGYDCREYFSGALGAFFGSVIIISLIAQDDSRAGR